MSRRKLGFWFRLAVTVLRPPMMVLTKRDWRGGEHLPASGGVIVVTNHISYVDPVAFAHYLYDHGREPRFLAKSSLFEVPFVGRVIRGCQQIPVYRKSTDAALAFRGAVGAIERGECVGFYPEGTVTRDPGLWPMTGKTGAARVALATGAPVIPIAQWGAHEMLAPYAKRFRLFPRKTMHLVAGPPVDLSAFEGRDLTAEVLRAATSVIMDALTELLEKIRGENAPIERFDTRRHGVPETGNPHRRSGGDERPGRRR
ncbi:MAG: lysophospholipid acyltransferase family protein [Carbonactinosporaceae bacterium]